MKCCKQFNSQSIHRLFLHLDNVLFESLFDGVYFSSFIMSVRTIVELNLNVKYETVDFQCTFNFSKHQIIKVCVQGHKYRTHRSGEASLLK